MISKSLVSDANIWIDLHNGGILEHAFRLGAVWQTPDLVLAELVTPDSDHPVELGLEVVELSPVQVTRIWHLARRYPRPSTRDIAALVLASWTGQVLITGDGHLRDAAATEGVEVHGLLWLLDQMVAHAVVHSELAASALRAMVAAGARLPSQEVANRLRAWEAAG